MRVNRGYFPNAVHGGLPASCVALFILALAASACASSSILPSAQSLRLTASQDPTVISVSPAPAPTPTSSRTPSSTFTVTVSAASPDLPPGAYIAYVRCPARAAYGCSLVAVSPDGATRRTLVDHVSDSARLSSNGTTVAYVDTPSGDLRILDLASGEERRFDLTEEVFWLSWSPDASEMLLSSPWTVSLLNLTTGVPKTVLECGASFEDPGFSCGPAEWSADGSWIALSLVREISGTSDARNGVYAVDAACLDTAEDCLPSKVGPYPEGAYGWSTDGHTMAICASVAGQYVFIFVEPTTREAREGTTCGSAHWLAWAPDDDTIAVSVYMYLNVIDVSSGTARDVVVDESLQRVVSWLTIPPDK